MISRDFTPIEIAYRALIRQLEAYTTDSQSFVKRGMKAPVFGKAIIYRGSNSLSGSYAELELHLRRTSGGRE